MLEELLKIRNRLLVSGLQDRGGVGWKVQNHYKCVIFKVRWVSRHIVQDEKGFLEMHVNVRTKTQIPLKKKKN